MLFALLLFALILYKHRRSKALSILERNECKMENTINNTLPKDSGSTREFDTGAHRDNATGKGRCDLLPLSEVAEVMDDNVLRNIASFMLSHNPEYLKEALREASHLEVYQNLPNMMLEASHLYEAGAIKYGENNWKRGMPLKCYIDSGVRHYLKTLRGDDDEPHYRGFVWNILGALWTINNIENPFEGFVVVE